MITLDLSILNQKGTPMFYSDILSARPNFGIAGRIFISTDTYEFYRDTGSAWDLIGGSGTGTITGSGTTGTLSKFTGSSSIGDSIVSETGSALTINGTAKATNWYVGTPSDLTRAFAAAGNANDIALWLEEYTTTGTGTPDIFFRNGRGTLSSKANIQVGDALGGLAWAGYLGTTFSDSASFSTEVVNIDSTNNHADVDIELFQSYNSATLRNTLKIRAADGYVTAPNGGFENVLTKTALASEGWYGLSSAEYITIPANTSFNNQGFALSTFVGANLMTYQGNATYGNGNGTSSVFGQNGFGFSSAGSTITLNQRSGGTNAFAGVTAFNYTIGSTNGTISHLAGLHVLAPYQVSSAILSVTNYYGALINASDERTAFSITNKWGIYQEGLSDKNYFAANVLLGSTIDNGNRLQVTGNGYISGFLGIGVSSFAGGYVLEVAGLQRNIGANNELRFGEFDSNYNYFQGINSTGTLSKGFIFFGTSEYARITPTGNLGIGNFGTNAKLEVSASSGEVFRADAASGAYRIVANQSVVALGGNVLIGSFSNPGQKLYLNGSFRIDGQTSGTAGGTSGQHLIINCDGTTYKIALLNP